MGAQTSTLVGSSQTTWSLFSDCHFSQGWISNATSQEFNPSQGSGPATALRRTMSASWPKYKPPYLPCSCTDLLPLSLAGPHSPHANTQLNTDKATLLDLSQPVSLAKCVNHSLSVPHFLSVCDSPLPPFWTCLHGSILSFYLPPISPHPIRHSASIAPWEEEEEEEDGPSCCAQVCLSEITVCVRLHEGMKEREGGASENTITEQVSFHLCRSQLTFSLSL